MTTTDHKSITALQFPSSSPLPSAAFVHSSASARCPLSTRVSTVYSPQLPTDHTRETLRPPDQTTPGSSLGRPTDNSDKSARKTTRSASENPANHPHTVTVASPERMSPGAGRPFRLAAYQRLTWRGGRNGSDVRPRLSLTD